MEKNSKVEEKILDVQMFGKFQISGMGETLDEDAIHSEMLTKLLAYFFCHRENGISIQKAAEALWRKEGSDNPAGALKNLMYRLRNLLKKKWPEQEFIVTGRNIYKWTDGVQVVIDIEKFDDYCEKANEAHDNDERIIAYQKAVELYEGMFLTSFTEDYWIASLSTYYHSVYLNIAKELLLLLEQDNRYGKMAKLCTDAIQIDALDEELHYYFIKSLIGQKKNKLALEQYQKATTILYEKLGIRSSQKLRSVYEELLKQMHEQEPDIEAIQAELREEEGGGAFLCEYEVFKKTYHLEMRRAERTGMSIYLAQITAVPTMEIDIESQEYQELISKAMDNLQIVLRETLRSGDVISKYSRAQFVILLPTCQYETAQKVMGRVEKSFYGKSKKMQSRLQYSYDEILIN